MLRRKLMLILFTLTALFMALAVAALWSLQRVFVDLDHLGTATTAVDHVSELNTSLSSVQVELYALQTGRQHHLDRLVEEIESIHRTADELGKHYIVQESEMNPIYGQFMTRLDGFEDLVGVLATANDRELSLRYNLACLDRAAQMHQELLLIARYVQSHTRAEQSMITEEFRWLVVAIALGFLVVINTSILMLLRTAGMILRPVDRLVQASRELAKENFEHRVPLGQADEFDELARAYNHLAQELQENERRRIQTLQQTALTLNHELNNAITTIDLQLTLLRRRSGRDEAMQKGLGQIQENLQRMSEVIASLKQLKRVVLTDYVDGVKMLDLHESTREDGPGAVVDQ
jgi:HAMP domain-containing protein